MIALLCQEPGKFIYKETATPSFKQGNALIRVRRIGVCGTDLHAYQGTQPYFEYPRILGHEIAGEILEIDKKSGFSVGDPVTILPYFNCENCVACRMNRPNCCTQLKVFGVHIDGGMSQYISIPSKYVVSSKGLSFDAAALVEPLSIGAHAVRRANVEIGEYVLVIGTGPIGLGIIEFARIAGAQIIALDVNEKRLKFCRERLGIKHCLNAGSPDLMNELKKITNDDMPTVVFDATGNLQAINSGFSYLSHGGRYVLVGLQKNNIAFSHPEFHKREATLMSSRNATIEDFRLVMEAMKVGLVDPTTYITHRVDFYQTKNDFKSWLDPETSVVKAMVTID